MAPVETCTYTPQDARLGLSLSDDFGCVTSSSLAAALATADVDLPWLNSSSTPIYPVIAPPRDAARVRHRAPLGALDFHHIFPGHAKGGGVAEVTKERLAACVGASAAGSATVPTSGTLQVRICADSLDVSGIHLVAKLATTVQEIHLNRPLRKEISFNLDGNDHLLHVEAAEEGELKSHGWGATAIRVASLLPGDWHRRGVHLRGHDMEVQFEVRVEYPLGSLLAEQLLQRSGLGLLSAAETEDLRAPNCTSGKPGCIISIPEDWADGIGEDVEEGQDRARSRGKGKSPRRQLFCAPDDLFEPPVIKVVDPLAGLASTWEYTARSYKINRTYNAGRCSSAWPSADQDPDEVLATGAAHTSIASGKLSSAESKSETVDPANQEEATPSDLPSGLSRLFGGVSLLSSSGDGDDKSVGGASTSPLLKTNLAASGNSAGTSLTASIFGGSSSSSGSSSSGSSSSSNSSSSSTAASGLSGSLSIFGSTASPSLGGSASFLGSSSSLFGSSSSTPLSGTGPLFGSSSQSGLGGVPSLFDSSKAASAGSASSSLSAPASGASASSSSALFPLGAPPLGGAFPAFGQSSSPCGGASSAQSSPFAAGATSLFSHLATKPQESSSSVGLATAGSASFSPLGSASFGLGGTQANSGGVGLASSSSSTTAPATPSTYAPQPAAGPQLGYRERCAQLVASMQETEDGLQGFRNDPQQKEFRLAVKKKLNTKVSQISATWSRIRDCTQNLNQTLSQYLQQGQGPRCKFVEYAMAERFADDAEVGIKAQPRAAWAVAQVAVRIFAQFPAVKALFWGFMYRACPYLMPSFSGSQVGRTGPAPAQRANEPFSEFADRMVSYHRLQLAIHVVGGDLGCVWEWLARTLNDPPAPVAAPLLHAALEVAGSDAQARYRRQFLKLVAYIDRDYMRELEALQGKVRGEEADQLRASNSRLRHWLDDFRARGRAPPPDGRHIEVMEEAELNPDA